MPKRRQPRPRIPPNFYLPCARCPAPTPKFTSLAAWAEHEHWVHDTVWQCVVCEKMHRHYHKYRSHVVEMEHWHEENKVDFVLVDGSGSRVVWKAGEGLGEVERVEESEGEHEAEKEDSGNGQLEAGEGCNKEEEREDLDMASEEDAQGGFGLPDADGLASERLSSDFETLNTHKYGKNISDYSSPLSSPPSEVRDLFSSPAPAITTKVDKRQARVTPIKLESDGDDSEIIRPTYIAKGKARATTAEVDEQLRIPDFRLLNSLSPHKIQPALHFVLSDDEDEDDEIAVIEMPENWPVAQQGDAGNSVVKVKKERSTDGTPTSSGRSGAGKVSALRQITFGNMEGGAASARTPGTVVVQLLENDSAGIQYTTSPRSRKISPMRALNPQHLEILSRSPPPPHNPRSQNIPRERTLQSLQPQYFQILTSTPPPIPISSTPNSPAPTSASASTAQYSMRPRRKASTTDFELMELEFEVKRKMLQAEEARMRLAGAQLEIEEAELMVKRKRLGRG